MPKEVRRVKLRGDVHAHKCDGIAEAFALGVHIQLLAVSEYILITLPAKSPRHRKPPSYPLPPPYNFLWYAILSPSAMP